MNPTIINGYYPDRVYASPHIATSQRQGWSLLGMWFAEKGDEHEGQRSRHWCFALRRRAPSSASSTTHYLARSPEKSSNFWKRLTFRWLNPLINAGHRRTIEPSDLWRVDAGNEAKVIGELLAAKFEEYRIKEAKSPLLWACNAVYRWKFWFSGCLKLTSDIVIFLVPLLVRNMILFLEDFDKSPSAYGVGFGYILGIVGMMQVSSLCLNHSLYLAMLTGGLVRTSLSTLIYRKGQRLSYQARLTYDSASLINMYANDTIRIDFAAGYFHTLWTAPVQLGICLGLLLYTSGVSALTGFFLLFLAIPIVSLTSKFMSRWRVSSFVFTDSRIRLLQEALSSIKAIKYYAWETAFLEKIKGLRALEIDLNKKIAISRAVMFFISRVMRVFAPMITVIALFFISPKYFTSAVVFPLLTLFGLLQQPLLLFPIAITSSNEARIAFKRIENLLLAEERSNDIVVDEKMSDAIRLSNACFTWNIEKCTTPKPDVVRGWRRLFKHHESKVEDKEKHITSPSEEELEEHEINSAVHVIQRAESISLFEGVCEFDSLPSRLSSTSKNVMERSGHAESTRKFSVATISLDSVDENAPLSGRTSHPTLSHPFHMTATHLAKLETHLPQPTISPVQHSAKSHLGISNSPLQRLRRQSTLSFAGNRRKAQDSVGPFKHLNRIFTQDLSTPESEGSSPSALLRASTGRFPSLQRRSTGFSQFLAPWKPRQTSAMSSTTAPTQRLRLVTDCRLLSSAPRLSRFSFSLTRAIRRDASNIQNVSFTISKGEFVAICGSIGSGKSSLLSGLVGEMPRLSGLLYIGGSISYCPQTPWILSASIRDNIIFGLPFDQAKYDRVIDMCDLLRDIKQFPSDDATEIGERGVTASGGQKARIALARAVYFDPDILCFDDVLSALDAHVGKHIFYECFLQYLANKTRILVTHNIDILSKVDRVIFVNDTGDIEIGTMEQLERSSSNFRRHILLASHNQTSADDEKENEVTDEIQISEDIMIGNDLKINEGQYSKLSWRVYLEYVRSSGGMFYACIIVFLVVLVQASSIITNLWLSYWVGGFFDLANSQYISIYVSLGVLQAIAFITFGLVLVRGGNKAAKRLVEEAIRRVMYAPMYFFDFTPLGSIILHYSRDVSKMDNSISDTFRVASLSMSSILSIMILSTVAFHYFIIPFAFMTGFFIYVTSYYRACTKQLLQYESKAFSAVVAHFSESLTGTSVIRAYGLLDRFNDINYKLLDKMNQVYFLSIPSQRWMGVRVEFAGILLVLLLGILMVTHPLKDAAAVSALVLSYSIQFVNSLSWATRQFMDVEVSMISCQKILHHGRDLETEESLATNDYQPPKPWPNQGSISIQDITLRYKESLPPVLNRLSLEIKGGERIGIVGRTGAGKSSLMIALFRFCKLSQGRILIDGVDIANVGLHTLRSKISIIPQDPALFQGTIRSNLDPFNERKDQELWDALRRTWLVDESEIPPDVAEPDSQQAKPRFDLDAVVENEGSNFSLGERQCLSLARVLVRQSKILMLDEATSSVDLETDMRIQRTISQEFSECTLLCIAHRLRTIIKYDKVCVLERGQVAEFDHPASLYHRADSMFRTMCDKSQITAQDFI